MSIFIIAEIGINHNGDIDIARRLIEGSAKAGVNAVKLQKRTIDKVYDAATLAAPRESPWGKTQRDQKLGLEFGRQHYKEIDRICRDNGIVWFASAWDVEAQEFLREFNLAYNKIASAMLTHHRLLEAVAEEKKHTFISTGMSTMEEITTAVSLFRRAECPFELMHCNSSYPMEVRDANLALIPALRERFKCNVGYSGHETGLAVSIAAAALGATSIERHVTLDRAMYGSDQAASVEIGGLERLVDYIRTVEAACGDGIKVITPSEMSARKKLAPWSIDSTLDHPNNPHRPALRTVAANR